MEEAAKDVKEMKEEMKNVVKAMEAQTRATDRLADAILALARAPPSSPPPARRRRRHSSSSSSGLPLLPRSPARRID